MPLDLAYDLSNYTPADAAPPQANFQRLEQYINQEAITRDGVTAMTGQLKLVGNPVAPLDAASKQYVDLLLPVGVILPFGGIAVPGGGLWAISNGATLATVDYPELFAAYSYTYGGSGGSFNLAPLVGRVPIGPGGAAGALGATGGSSDATLPSHNHNVSIGGTGGTDNRDLNHWHDMWHGHASRTDVQGNHNHNIGDGTQLYWVQGGQFEGVPGPGSAGRSGAWQTQGAHAHNISIDGPSPQNTNWMNQNNNHSHNVSVSVSGPSASAGVAPTNANLPPYVVVNWIVRVK